MSYIGDNKIMNVLFFPFVSGVSSRNSNNVCVCTVKNVNGLKVFSKKDKMIMINIPIIRGIVFLFSFTLCYVKDFIFLNTNVQEEKLKLVNKVSNALNISYKIAFIILTLLFSFVCSSIILGYIPIIIASNISLYNIVLQRILVALLKSIFTIAILLLLRLYNPYKQLLRFNSSINNFYLECQKREKNGYFPLNYFVYLLFSFLVSYFVLSLLGLTAYSIVNVLVNFLVTIFCFSLCFEILYLVSKSKNCLVFNIFKPLNLIFNEESSNLEELAVKTAYNEVTLMSENNKRKIIKEEDDEKVSFSFVYSFVKEELAKSGINDSSEVDWLIAEAVEKNRAEIKLMSSISKDKFNQIKDIVQERVKGKPLTKIMGKTTFYGLTFLVNENVLSPRMETELLVEKVILNCKKGTKVLDIGTGSGAIAVSVAKFSEAIVTAIDVSDKALMTAKENAKKNEVNVKFIKSNLFSNLKKNNKFDIIVSNPPYIKTEDIELLSNEVKSYDPIISLDGGKDGLDFYRDIAVKGYDYLKKDAILLFEIGFDQGRKVKNIMKPYYDDIKLIKDYSGNDRIVIGKRKKDVNENRKN